VILRLMGSAPHLILKMSSDISLLQSSSGTNKFIIILNQMSMKLHGKSERFYESRQKVISGPRIRPVKRT